MELIWIPALGAYAYSIYVCFKKGKAGYAWTGIAGLFPSSRIFSFGFRAPAQCVPASRTRHGSSNASHPGVMLHT